MAIPPTWGQCGQLVLEAFRQTGGGPGTTLDIQDLLRTGTPLRDVRKGLIWCVARGYVEVDHDLLSPLYRLTNAGHESAPTAAPPP